MCDTTGSTDKYKNKHIIVESREFNMMLILVDILVTFCTAKHTANIQDLQSH